ncbi:LCP family protein [Actinoallomurus sp. NPDC052308]|uniref:LCP family protein n=1 Tax=Actinoallomurus sp. NPDC052308 TaxID=3155530 RepID=UPI0034227BD4
MLDVLIVLLIGCCAFAETAPRRVDAIGGYYPGRPTWGLGQDWLLVLYDEPRPDQLRHDGPRHDERRAAATRGIGTGRRQVDTIMLLHLPSTGGRPTLIDLPPDAYAPAVAGHGAGSLRAAFAWGGPPLLVRTTESVTHVGVERYLEIGLTGLATLVGLVGGVRICARPAGAATAGPPSPGTVRSARTPGPPTACPRLSGRQALAYLRAAAHNRGDLDHAEHQRRLVTALVRAMAGPGVALNPVRGLSLMAHGTGTVTTDEGAHLYDLIRLALTLRETGDLPPTVISTVGHGSVPGVGRVVTLNPAEVSEIARALVTDCPKPGCPDR